MDSSRALALRSLLHGQQVAALATLHKGEPAVSMVPYALLPNGQGFVINAEKIRVTGTKLKDKIYYRHTGTIGNMKSAPLEKLLAKGDTRLLLAPVGAALPPRVRVTAKSEWFTMQDAALQLLPLQEEMPFVVASQISPSGMTLVLVDGRRSWTRVARARSGV